MAVQRGTASRGIGYRITSYNVCYTKLLRNKPVRKFSNEEAKKIAIHSVMSSITSDNAITEFAEKQLPSIREGETAKDKVSENINNISLAYSQESGHALIESVEPRYRGFALKLRDDLKKERNNFV